MSTLAGLSVSALESVKNELSLARAWLDRGGGGGGVSRDGVVAKTLRSALETMQGQIEREEASRASASGQQQQQLSGSGWRLKIRTPDSQTVVLAAVSPTLTLRELKTLIESSLEKPLDVCRLRVASTGQAWGNFDSKTLQACNIQNNDVLTVEGSGGMTGAGAGAAAISIASTATTQSQSPSSPLSRAASTGLWPTTRLQAMTLAVHCAMLDAGFCCVAEVASTVPGFAPPLREVPPTKFLPEGWNAHPSNVAVLYKHSKLTGKQLSLSLVLLSDGSVDVGDVILATLSVKGGSSATIELVLADVLQSGLSDAEIAAAGAGAGGGEKERQLCLIFQDVPSLMRAYSGLINQILPRPATTTASSSSSSSSQSQPQHPSRPSPQGPCLGWRGGSGQPGPTSPPWPQRIGAEDLDPFSGAGAMPGGLLGPGAGSAVMGGGGLVGPGHGIFSGPRFGSGPGVPGGAGGAGPGPGWYPTQPGYMGGGMGVPGLGGPGTMEPRFDPFGPPINPIAEGGRVPGRGVGQGPGGEPLPDHLVPPDADSNVMIDVGIGGAGVGLGPFGTAGSGRGRGRGRGGGGPGSGFGFGAGSQFT